MRLSPRVVRIAPAELDAYIEARREGRRRSTWSRRPKVWITWTCGCGLPDRRRRFMGLG